MPPSMIISTGNLFMLTGLRRSESLDYALSSKKLLESTFRDEALAASNGNSQY